MLGCACRYLYIVCWQGIPFFIKQGCNSILKCFGLFATLFTPKYNSPKTVAEIEKEDSLLILLAI